jgi:hypothetical protein
MQRRTVFFIFFVITSMIFVLSGTISAKELKNYDELYKQLPGGNPNNAGVIDQAIKSMVKMQELREGKLVTVDKPKDLLIINPRFISISFDAGVKKTGVSAKAKPTPAVYALLFEKDNKNELSFYKSIFLVWQGEQDLEEYRTVTPEKVCEYYRGKGADYVFLDKKSEPVKPEEIVLNGSQIKSGIIAEQFIDSAITRDVEMREALEGYVKKEVEKTRAAVPDEAAKIQQLEARIKKLESLLANVSRSGNDIVFSGVNVFIQNGTGTVGRTNGVGNLVVGYDDPGSGSHNVVVGSKNKCSSFGSIVSGSGNTVSGKFAAAIGGHGNSASGDSSSVLGGRDNSASGAYSSVMGGSENKAKGDYTGINGMRGRTKVNEGDNKHFQND